MRAHAMNFADILRQWKHLWIGFNVTLLLVYLITFLCNPLTGRTISQSPTMFISSWAAQIFAANLFFFQGPVLECILRPFRLIVVPHFRYSLVTFGTLLAVLFAVLYGWDLSGGTL
jgi:hypothetical protein